MKRLLLVAAIFLVTLSVCVLSLFALKKQCEKFAAKLDEIEQSAAVDSKEVTAELIAEFNEEWHHIEYKLSRFVRGAQLDELTAIFARLGPLFEYGEQADFYAEINRGRTLLEHIWFTERPTLTNIF